MQSSRISPVNAPYHPTVQAQFDKIMRGAPPLLLFRTVARNPRVLQRLIAGGLLDPGRISIRCRELMILRTCARCDAEYEWGVHIALFGASAKWTQKQIESSKYGSAADGCWTTEDRLVLRLADQLHDSCNADDALWHDASAHFADDQLIELVMLAGLYHAVSYIANALGIQQEAFAPRFPTNSNPV